MNTFSETAALRIFFKTGALKNFAIFWIKKSLQRKYFPVSAIF